MKSAKFRRLLAIAVTAVMVLSFVACGKSKDTQTGTDTTKTTAQAESTAVDKPFDPNAKFEPAITIKYGYELANAKIKFNGQETIEKNAWNDLYAESGINIKPMWNIDNDADQKKLKTAIASGDYPDVFTANSQNYVNWSKSGVVADITSLFDQYQTDHTKEYFAADGGLGLKSARVDGKLYGLPMVGNVLDSAMQLWIRADWLKNLNLQAPKTVDELINVANAFTTQDPDKNGKNDTYGLGMNGKQVNLYVGGVQAFLEPFGAYIGTWTGEYTFVKDPSGSGVVWGGALPGVKDGLKKLQDLYKSGAISKDFGIKDDVKLQEEFIAGKYGMIYGPMWTSLWIQDVAKNNPNADLTCVPMPGIDSSSYGKTFLPNATGYYWCVSSKCKNPEVLLKLFNTSLEKLAYYKDQAEYDKYVGKNETPDEFKLALTRALPPVKNYDNHKKVTPAVSEKDPTGLNSEQKSIYDGCLKYLDAAKKDLKVDEQRAGWATYKVFAAPDGGYAALDQMVKANYNYMPAAYNAPNTELMASKFATLDKLVKETVIKIIYGNASLDDYDKMLADWKKLGGDEVTKEANDWYAANEK